MTDPIKKTNKPIAIYNISEEIVADAMIFVGKQDKKIEWRWKEVVLLTFVKFGKPINIFDTVENLKKFERFIPFSTPETIKQLAWKKIQVQTGFAVL